MYPEKWFPTVREMLDHEVRKGKNGKMTWEDFSENLVSGCYGPDQVYYKYKTDYWHEGGGFPTPSKKFEFKSQHLESLGYDGLPVFSEPGESPVSTPELYKDYPLLLSTGFRQPFYFLGQYRNIPWLRSYMEFPQCQMHPETAKEYGVEDGDIIWIETKRGRIRQKLHEFAGIKKGMVMATANWFYPEEPAKGYHGVFISNPNVLTSNDHLDPMYGSPDMTCLICKVYATTEEDLADGVFRTTATARCRRSTSSEAPCRLPARGGPPGRRGPVHVAGGGARRSGARRVRGGPGVRPERRCRRPRARARRGRARGSTCVSAAAEARSGEPSAIAATICSCVANTSSSVLSRISSSTGRKRSARTAFMASASLGLCAAAAMLRWIPASAWNSDARRPRLRSFSSARSMASRSLSVRRSAASCASRRSTVMRNSKMSSSSPLCSVIHCSQQRCRVSRSLTREPPWAPRVVTRYPAVSRERSAMRSVMREMPR